MLRTINVVAEVRSFFAATAHCLGTSQFQEELQWTTITKVPFMDIALQARLLLPVLQNIYQQTKSHKFQYGKKFPDVVKLNI